jgi:hypothetical protein
MRVALLFIDGVGLGPRDPGENPLVDGDWLVSQFNDGSGTALPPCGRRFDLETTFGVPGRPQSASNQTAIWTGVDAPRLLGRHLLGYPNAALRGLLAEHSIAKRLAARGARTSLLNAYPEALLAAWGLPCFEGDEPAGELPALIKRRVQPSAGVWGAVAGGARLRTLAQARRGEALSHDLEGAQGQARFGLPRRSPAEAAEIFWGAAADFTVFEHYQADEAGHAQNRDAVARAVGSFDAFAREVLARRPADVVVLVTSDHGNVEALGTRGHTRNPVPLLVFGAPQGLPSLETVADVGRAVVELCR